MNKIKHLIKRSENVPASIDYGDAGMLAAAISVGAKT
jgi:hypothetical protein